MSAPVNVEEIKTTNVQVAVRCRPVNAEERRTNQPTAIACDSSNKSVTVSTGPAGKKTSKTFSFDKVFGMYSTQEEVFEQMVRPIVDEALAGFNCTIFAYGQTGTGKTHTMEGDIHSEADAGIVPRSVKTILETLEASGSEFTIRVSFLELYNEELQDLLVPPSASTSDKKLKLCEDVKKGVVCQNLEEITVLNKKDIFDILQRGIKQRATAATLCNKNSSRSHSIFTMKIMIKECSVDGEEVVRHGQLNLVDLAGSECVGRSGAKNDRAKEAGSINQSLLTLGRVITALVDHHGHIPYRDSKLTRLLQESLGGKAKTCIIATLSPAQMAVEESMSTLDYAHRAKNIKNAPQLNQRMTKKVVLKEYCAEIETLRAQLQLTREKNGVYVDPNEYYAMEARISSQETQLLDCESALRQRNEEVKCLRVEKEEIHHQLGEANRTLESTTATLMSTESALQVAKDDLVVVQVELVAAEAVVVEQCATEGQLTIQGGVLQNEVELRRRDRDALLVKVERLGDQEVQRLNTADQFVADVTASKNALLSSVQQILVDNRADSRQLCGGVLKMLTKGKDTCSLLQGSIDSALTILIQDAEVAKEEMSSSCAQLSTHLSTTHGQLETALRGMQGTLSAWLGEVDENMKKATTQLAQQEQHIAALTAQLASSADAMTTLTAAYTASQAAQSQSATQAHNQLQSELSRRLEDHKQEIAAQAEMAKETVASKAAKIEQTMHSLLKDLLQSSTSAYSSSSSVTAQFCSDTTESINAFATTAQQLQNNADTLVNSHVQEIAELVQTQQSSSGSVIGFIVDAQAAASAIVDGISSAVDGKRKDLDDSVNRVCIEAGDAISSACVSVSRTSETANTILQKVRGATESMNESASAAMSGFQTFLDSEGATVCSGVETHFAVLESHLSNQVEGLEEVSDLVTKFGEKMAEAIVVPTGSTPRKMVYSELDALATTRPHVEIKSEARANKQAVAPVVAQTSHEAVPSIQNDSPAIAPIAVSDVKIELASAKIISGIENANPQVPAPRPSGLSKGVVPRAKSQTEMRATGDGTKESRSRTVSSGSGVDK